MTDLTEDPPCFSCLVFLALHGVSGHTGMRNLAPGKLNLRWSACWNNWNDTRLRKGNSSSRP